MKAKFLVLGVGNAQVDLLAHLRGHFEVHALSNVRSGRGLPFVDHFEAIDITNREAVLDYARQHSVDVLYSVGSDVAMPTVAHVSEALHLPCFVSARVAETCNNKVAMRSALQHTYGALPFLLVRGDDAVDWDAFPAVVKPADSQGQRGVSMVESREGISQALSAALPHSRTQQAIIEPLVAGREISVNAYLRDGEVVFFLPSDRISWAGFDGGIIHRHIVPASLSELETKRVRRLVDETLATLGLSNGPAYFQIKLDHGRPYLIEVTPRLDGCHMWRLIKSATGVDLLAMTVKHLVSGSVDTPAWHEAAKLELEFFCQPPGTPFVKPVPRDDALHLEWYYDSGEAVRCMNGKMEKCGYQIVPGSAT